MAIGKIQRKCQERRKWTTNKMKISMNKDVIKLLVAIS